MTIRFIKYVSAVLLLVLLAGSVMYNLFRVTHFDKPKKNTVAASWQAPDTSKLAFNGVDTLIRYGRALIENTAIYLGPKGSITHIANRMNCQNCHLDAGTRPFANNFALVATTYPKYRERSARFESIEFRINECLQRSLNGQQLDSLSREMRAMVAYIKWVGGNITEGAKPPGTGMEELSYMTRAADTIRGKAVYVNKCRSCHGENGEGLAMPGDTGYRYPPLWGPNSFNVSAGMYRLSHMAVFVKYNMPYTAVTGTAQLSDEEAWDVASFVNSRQRPQKFFNLDWPDINTKPVDYPFGPYADSFSASRHKFGPFKELKEAKAGLQKKSR